MLINDSVNLKKTFFIDSLSYTMPNVSPAMHIVNNQTWSDNLESQLKTNILFKQDSIEQENDISANQLIIQEKIVLNEIKLPVESFDWFFLWFIILLVMLALIKILNFKNATNKPFAFLLSIENNSLKTSTLLFAFLYMCLGMGLILYSFLGSLLPIKSELLKISIFISSFSLLLLLKLIIYSFTGALFNVKEQTQKYIHNIIIINYYIAVFLFPFAFIYHYFPFEFLGYIVCVLWTLIYLYRIGQGFFIFKSKYYIYENFLYFCTIEILPLLLGIKITLNYI